MKLIDWILPIYPPAWRERYEQEMRVVLEEHEFTLLTACDLLLGAVDARLDPYYRREGPLLAHMIIRVSTITFLYMLAIVFVLFNLWEVVLIADNSMFHAVASRVDPLLGIMTVVDGYYLLQTGLEMAVIVVFFIYGRRMMRRWGWRKALFVAACFLLPVLAVIFIAINSFATNSVGLQQGLEAARSMVQVAVIVGALLGNIVVAFVKLRSLRAARKVGQFRFLLGTEIVFVVIPVLMTLYYHVALLATYMGRLGLAILPTMLTPFNLLAILCFFVVTERWSRRATTFVFACAGLFMITALAVATIVQAQALNFMQQIMNYAETTGVLTIIAALVGIAVLMMVQSWQLRWKMSLVGHVKEYEEPLSPMEMGKYGEGE